MKLYEEKKAAAIWTTSTLSLSRRAIFTGLGIGTLLSILNMFVFFKTGIGFGGSALVAVGSIAILKRVKALNWRNALIAFSVASSGYFATAALDSGLLAVFIQTHQLPAWPIVILLSVGSNLIGVLLGYKISSYFVYKWQLPYPTLKPAITVLEQSEKQDEYFKALLWGTLLGFLLVMIKHLFPATGRLGIPGTPSFMHLELSPMLFGLGILIRQKAALWMLAGAVYAALIWFTQGISPVMSFSQHITSPWILGAGVFIIAGSSAATLFKSRNVFPELLSRWFTHISTFRKTWGLIGAAACILLICYGLFTGLQGIIALAGVLLVMVISVMYFNQSGGQIGLAPLNPILFLSILLLFFMQLQTDLIILTAATIACIACSSLYFAYSVKIAKGKQEIRSREILWTQIIGSVAGSLVGTLFIYLIAYQGHPGTELMPVPTAVSLNYFMDSLHERTVYSDGMMGVVGGSLILGFVMTFTAAAPISLGIGMLLSPGSVASIAAGGLVYMLVQKYMTSKLDTLDKLATGLIIGEGITDFVLLIQQLFV